jgi:uncharacterized protein YndB with AHSA1/START domain
MESFLFSVERECPVSLSTLWNAWVDAEALEDWYHPTDLSVQPGSVTSDAQPGGWWTVAVDVPSHGFSAYFFGRYTEVQLHDHLVHTLAYTQDTDVFVSRDESLPHHVIRIDFEKRGASAWVRFTQFGEMPLEQIPPTKAGMESYFDSLDEYLSRAG